MISLARGLALSSVIVVSTTWDQSCKSFTAAHVVPPTIRALVEGVGINRFLIG